MKLLKHYPALFWFSLQLMLYLSVTLLLNTEMEKNIKVCSIFFVYNLGQLQNPEIYIPIIINQQAILHLPYLENKMWLLKEATVIYKIL